jgi:hypothetical protein
MYPVTDTEKGTKGDCSPQVVMCESVLGIRDILVQIRIRGSIPLTYGSGSDYFL